MKIGWLNRLHRSHVRLFTSALVVKCIARVPHETLWSFFFLLSWFKNMFCWRFCIILWTRNIRVREGELLNIAQFIKYLKYHIEWEITKKWKSIFLNQNFWDKECVPPFWCCVTAEGDKLLNGWVTPYLLAAEAAAAAIAVIHCEYDYYCYYHDIHF